MQSRKFIDSFEVCKCGIICVNFYRVAVCILQLWNLATPARIKNETCLKTYINFCDPKRWTWNEFEEDGRGTTTKVLPTAVNWLKFLPRAETSSLVLKSSE